MTELSVEIRLTFSHCYACLSIYYYAHNHNKFLFSLFMFLLGSDWNGVNPLLLSESGKIKSRWEVLFHVAQVLAGISYGGTIDFTCFGTWLFCSPWFALSGVDGVFKARTSWGRSGTANHAKHCVTKLHYIIAKLLLPTVWQVAKHCVTKLHYIIAKLFAHCVASCRTLRNNVALYYRQILFANCVAGCQALRNKVALYYCPAAHAHCVACC